MTTASCWWGKQAGAMCRLVVCWGVLVVAFFSGPLVVGAAGECGSIVAPVRWDEGYAGTQTTEPVADCMDPFAVTAPVSPYVLSLDGEVAAAGATLVRPAGVAEVTYDPLYRDEMSITLYAFRHTTAGYEYVSLETREMTESDYLAALAADFTEPGEYEQYREIHLATDKDAYFYDADGNELVDEAGRAIGSRYWDAVYRAEAAFVPGLRQALPAGTYTFVWVESDLIMSAGPSPAPVWAGWWGMVRSAVLPTAHAAEVTAVEGDGSADTSTAAGLAGDTGTGARRYALTVTLVEAATPTGASSVLFLPGIQASHLYKNGLLGTEDQVWPPNSLLNNDVKALAMDTAGVSEEEIYTRDIIDSTTGVGQIYGDFINFMNQLESDKRIESWTPFAYDWRYGVEDIANNGTQYENEVKNAIEEIEALATTSFSKKVTIIAHSNGGLLAKMLMRRLGAEGQAHLIDKVVLLASPQLGTPKAIGTILHGYDQTDALGGIIMDGHVVRDVISNMPGAYGLLPSERYFAGLAEPLVSFKIGTATVPYREAYGTAISNFNDMLRFYNGADSADRNLSQPINIPATANEGLLSGAMAMHQSLLDAWLAPTGVKVIEIIGTGLPTMKAIEYREVTEDDCVPNEVGGSYCVTKSEIKPFARLTHYGDGTVVQRSAEAYEGDKEKYFVNLPEIRKSELLNKLAHHNVTEAQPVQDLISAIIVGDVVAQNQFVSTSHTEFADEYDIEVIDSPVRVLATDATGNQTGVMIENGQRVIKQNIPGSQYFEFGDTKYLVVPKGTNRTVKLHGEDHGGYTLTTLTLGSNDTQVVNTTLVNATVTPTMVAEYANTDSQYTTVVTDINGDGLKDMETTLDGVVIPPPKVITYTVLRSYIESLTLSQLRKQALLLMVRSAEVYAVKTPKRLLYQRLADRLLEGVDDLTRLYVKKKYLSPEAGAELISMTEALKANQ